MNVGQMFVAIDPKIVYDDDFYSEADKYIETLRNSKSIEGKSIILPGDDRKTIKEESLKYGIKLTDDTISKLENLFGEKLIFS